MYSKANKLIHILAILLLLFSCKKEKVTDDTFFNSKVLILGHGGMGIAYKKASNTWQSIEPALGIGADGVEIDIQLTKDTVLVLFHDKNLDPSTTCAGRIYEYTWAEIQKCKYYSYENFLFVNSAESLFSKLPNLTDLYFSFDCKIDTEVKDTALYQAQFLRAIKRLCEKYKMSDNVFLEADELLLLKAKSFGMKNKLFLANDLSAETIELASSNGYFGISADMKRFKSTAGQAHEKNLFLMIFTPGNYEENKLALTKNPDMIQTDDPISLLKMLNRYNYDYVIP